MVIPDAIRAELRAHAQDEAPNECCGVIVLRDGVAERYVRGVNTLASPYRYELYLDPVLWSELGDEQAIFHSHPETEAKPSRTDRQNIGEWAGQPYLIYSLRRDELRAWRVTRESAEEIPLAN